MNRTCVLFRIFCSSKSLQRMAAWCLPFMLLLSASVASAQHPQQRQIKARVTVTAKIQVPILGAITVTVPIDSGTIDLGVPNILEQHDVTGLPNGELLQPFVDALTALSLLIPEESIADEDITLNFNIRNIDATDQDNIKIAPVVVDGDTIPIFFFIRMTIETKYGVLARYDFRDGFPAVLKLPLGNFVALLEHSGFTGTPFDELGLAFLTPDGLTREGIFSATKGNDLFVRITHLSDLVGVRAQDIRPPRPPDITRRPVVEPDTTTAIVLWRTNRPSDSRVFYGTTPALGDSAETAADSTGVTEHQVALAGLQKATRYYFRVRSTDPFGQTVSSLIDSFKTRGIPDIAPPRITLGPVALDITTTSALIFWETDRRATSTVLYDSTAVLATQIVTDASLERRHRVTLTGLKSGKLYYYFVQSEAAGGTASSDTMTVQTPAELDTLPPVIIVPPNADFYGVTDTTAIITWVTDVASNSEVVFWKQGTTDTMTVVDAVPTNQHVVILTGLMPETIYRYFVRSTRVSNNRSVRSRVERFRTRASGQVPKLDFVISPQLVYQTDTYVVFRWRTNIPSDGYVYYMPDPDGTAVFSVDQSLVRGSDELDRHHLIGVSGLTPGMGYLFVITSSTPTGDALIWPPGTVFAKVIVVGNSRRLVPTGIRQVPGSTGRFTTNSQPDTQSPVILNGPSVIAQTDNQLVIQWETDELSTSVVNYGAGGNLTNTVQDPTQVTLHQLTVTNLAANTTYTYQVASTDPSNNGPTQSTQAVGATALSADTTPPVISDASITASPSDTRATVSWTTDEAASSEVRFGTNSHPDSLTLSVTDATPVTSHLLTLTSLTTSTPYYYRVFSTDVSNNGPTPSATNTFTTLATPDTAQPVLSTIQKAAVAKPDTSATLTVTWTTDKLATSFVDYDTVATLATKITVGDQTGTLTHSLSVTKLTLNKTYYFKVGSVNVNDTRVPAPAALSALDNQQMPASVDATPPSTPTTVVAIPGDGAVRVRWAPSTDASGIAGYNLTRNSAAIVSNVQDTTYLDVNVTNGTAYSYTVAALDLGGNTGTASAATANVTPNTTQVPTAPTSVATPDTVSLKPVLIVGDATPVTGDASRATLVYAFQVAEDSLFTTLTAAKTGIAQGTSTNPTHWQVLDVGQTDSTALVSGTRYYWRSRANDSVFDGGWSAKRTFIASTSKPSAVELASFAATDERGVVTVTWTIARGQPGLTGFHVYRSLRPQAGFEKLTKTPVTGQAFQYVDRGVTVNQVYYYQVEAVYAAGLSTRFGPIAIRVSAPKVFALGQNYPNPFNPETTIRFDLPTASVVTLKVYNLLGQEVVALLHNEPKEAGFYAIRWNGRSHSGERVSSGIYFYRLEAGAFVKTRKMALVK
ncbi:MAG: fibronectin type III domain-containing protein [Candidatus Latescibacteria bacterium]|nr:fibronectin type III domain-containing protein [Candidatus Latescibacterota bacterium]